ncbi:MAG: GNAT family N-acetyltransferase, partial [Candidatus Micrarchaeales archaeon]
IGPVNGVYDIGGGMLKGFYNKVIRDESSAGDFLAWLKPAMAQISSPESEVARLNVRVVVANSALRFLENVEAIVPIDYKYSLAYVGMGKKERTLDESEQSSLREAISTARSSVLLSGKTHRTPDSGYSIKIAKPGRLTPAQRRDIIDLLSYEEFEYIEQNINDILADETNVIAVCYHGDKIVGIAVAEYKEVQLDSYSRLHVVEIGDAVTKEEHRQKGIYTALISLLLEDAKGSGKFDVIYSEITIEQPGSLKASVNNGAQFANNNNGKLGILPNDLGGTNLAVAYYQA